MLVMVFVVLGVRQLVQRVLADEEEVEDFEDAESIEDEERDEPPYISSPCSMPQGQTLPNK